MPQSYIPDGRTDAFQIPEYQDIADAVEAFQAFADTCAHTDELIDHVADTTSVHGIADTSTLVTTNGSQTLTNKTLAAPTISNGATVTGTVTGVLQPSIVDAKGDLIVGTAADTAGRLAVGSNGQVLKADNSTATGLAWGTQSPHAMYAGQVTWNGENVPGNVPLTPIHDRNSGLAALVTLTYPVGRFTQTPITTVNALEDGDITWGIYAQAFVKFPSTSSVSLGIYYSGPLTTSVAKARFNVISIQMTSGSGAG